MPNGHPEREDQFPGHLHFIRWRLNGQRNFRNFTQGQDQCFCRRSRKGMADALSKMVDLGMYSKEVSPEEQAKGAWWIAVAKDAVLPPSMPITLSCRAEDNGLTRDELYNIFITGKIKTWGQAVT